MSNYYLFIMATTLTEKELNSLNLVNLKEEARKLKLTITGRKKDLIKRILGTKVSSLCRNNNIIKDFIHILFICLDF